MFNYQQIRPFPTEKFVLRIKIVLLPWLRNPLILCHIYYIARAFLCSVIGPRVYPKKRKTTPPVSIVMCPEIDGRATIKRIEEIAGVAF